MSEVKTAMPPEEKEGRINALRQLLANSVPDVVQALEGGGGVSEYTQLRNQREAWRNELFELTGEEEAAAVPGTRRAIDAPPDPMPDIVLTTINNAEIIEQLTGVIVQQAGIINQLQGVVGQLGAVTSLEADIVKLQADTAALVGEDPAGFSRADK